MAQSAMHQYWAENSIMLPRDVADAVALGAAVKWNGTKTVSASAEAWDTNVATTRKNFARDFAGNSAQEADAGEYIWSNGDAHKSKVRVDTAGCTRLPTLAAGTYAVGTLVGPTKDTGNALLDNSYTVVTDPEEATHRIVYVPVATNPSFGVGQILSREFAGTGIVQAFPRFAVIAGGAAGDLTVTGIGSGDQLLAVIRLNRDATAANIDLSNVTSEFSVTAANTINNTGGTNTTGDALMVVWARR